MKIILLDLFSGIGGFAKGLEDAGFEIVEHYFSEIDPHAIANYKYNFPHANYIGSVTFVRHIVRTIRESLKRYPTAKLVITFGSPCQDFSMAGNRAGLAGKKSALIKFALFLIRWLRPYLYIWENVKGAYTSNTGKDFWAIQKAFANIDGYRREQQLVNTSWILPQNRERIYLIGHAATNERSGQNIFPFGENDILFVGEKQLKESQTSNYKQIITNPNYVNVPKLAGCLTGGGHSGGLHSDMTTIEVVLNTEKEKIISVKPCLTPDRAEKRQNGRRFKDAGENSFTLTAQDIHGVKLTTKTEDIIRRLTEIECERLQGFDDNWTQWGLYPAKKIRNIDDIAYIVRKVPKTQRYKMLGNAVTKKMVQLIGIRYLQLCTTSLE